MSTPNHRHYHHPVSPHPPISDRSRSLAFGGGSSGSNFANQLAPNDRLGGARSSANHQPRNFADQRHQMHQSSFVGSRLNAAPQARPYNRHLVPMYRRSFSRSSSRSSSSGRSRSLSRPRSRSLSRPRSRSLSRPRSRSRTPPRYRRPLRPKRRLEMKLCMMCLTGTQLLPVTKCESLRLFCLKYIFTCI